MTGNLLLNLSLYTTFLCLGFTLWFAFYLLARSHANYLTFRAIVAMVAMAFYYNSALNALLAGTTEQSQIRSFTTTIAMIACHDLTHYLLNPQQRKKLYPVARGVVMFGVIAMILIFTAPPATPCAPEYVCPAIFSYPWLVIDLFRVFIFGSILFNLWQLKKTEGFLPSVAFFLAVMTGLGAVAYGLVGTVLDQPLPRVFPNLFILATLILLAYSVARDRTFVTRRTVTYDLPITFTTIAVIVVLYVLAGSRLKLPANELILIAVLAIFTHSAYDFVRDFLDRLVNRQELRTRQELHNLEHELSGRHSMEHYLNRGLAILCYNLRASCGFIAIRKDDQYRVVASLHSIPVGSPFPTRDVALEGLAEPSSTIFQRIAWLAPAHIGKEQIALVGIGLRKDKIPYSEDDLYWFEDIAQELGEMVHFHGWQSQAVIAEPQINASQSGLEPGKLSVDKNLFSALTYKPDLELVKYIEEGYRHLHDYDELGKSPLVALFGIKGDDHIECGKMVHEKLIQILEKLRPSGQPPPGQISSEWYAYTILHDSYVTEKLGRDIMAKLYIGEGTYYRLRRQAIRGITRALLEMGAVA